MGRMIVSQCNQMLLVFIQQQQSPQSKQQKYLYNKQTNRRSHHSHRSTLLFQRIGEYFAQKCSLVLRSAVLF